MNHLVSRVINISFAVIVAVFSINMTAVMDVAAKPVNNPPANNGTLKLHEFGTPDGTESNSPKVCTFNFEGFGFDAGQDGYIVIATQPGGVSTETMTFGPADAAGFDSTEYVNDGVSGLTVPNGHYKATLYGKGTGGAINLADEKAKSKVFKVECAVPPATPTVSIQAGACVQPGASNGVVNGSVVNTDDATDAAVTYTIAATHQTTAATTSVTVMVADGASGNFTIDGLKAGTYDLTVSGSDGTQTTQTTFTIATCAITVAPSAPFKIDICGTANDSYTIPATTGVTYLVDGTATVAGTYSGTGTVVITAVANVGYALRGTTSWTFTFKTTACPIVVTPAAPTKVDVCGKSNDTYTIPATPGVHYYVNGQSKSAGTYTTNIPVLITTAPAPGYLLDVHSQLAWLFIYTNKKCPQPCVPATTLAPLTFFGGHHGDDDEDCIPVSVIPTAPTFDDVCGNEDDAYTIPATPGVVYKVNGSAVGAGSYDATGAVTITAEAAQGYEIAKNSTAQWMFEFSNDACPAPVITATAVCSLAENGVIVTVVNTGDADGLVYINGQSVDVAAQSETEMIVPFDALLYSANVNVLLPNQAIVMSVALSCEPGRGSITPPSTSEKTSVSTPLAPATGLPMTGSNGISQLVLVVAMAIMVYGSTYFLLNRRSTR